MVSGVVPPYLSPMYIPNTGLALYLQHWPYPYMPNTGPSPISLTLALALYPSTLALAYILNTGPSHISLNTGPGPISLTLALALYP